METLFNKIVFAFGIYIAYIVKYTKKFSFYFGIEKLYLSQFDNYQSLSRLIKHNPHNSNINIY